MRFEQFIIMSSKLRPMRLQPNRIFTRKNPDPPNGCVKRKPVRIKSKSVKEFFKSFKVNDEDCSNAKNRPKSKDKENRPKSNKRRRARDLQPLLYSKRKILYVIKGDEDYREMVARDSATEDGNASSHDSDKECERASKRSSLKLIHYSRAELMKIGDDPICQTKPKIDPKFAHIMRTSNQRLILSPIDVMASSMPVRPHSYNSTNSDPFSALYPKFKTSGSQSPTHEERPQNREIPLDSKSRPIDPRDRVRKDQDGIVLSPQRRSFNTGCFVTVQSGRQSPLGKPLDGRDGAREMRRIGSGRILSRGEPMSAVNQNWSSQSSEFSFRSGGPARESVAFERRFNRDFERDKDRNSRLRDNDRMTLDRNNRYNKSGMNNNNDKRHHRMHWNEPEEPEWFSGGPTSQHDTIELHGFEKLDDSDGDDRRRRPGSRTKKSSENESDGGNSNDEKRSDGRKSASPVDPDHQKDMESNEVNQKDKNSEKKEKEESEKRDTDTNGGKSSGDSSGFISDFAGTEFNIDDFLRSDSLPILSNGTDRGDGGESRFASWFKRDVPQGSGCDSNRSSAHEEMFNSMINDITENNAPNNYHRNSYSPEPSGTSAALMDMLRTREGSGDASEKYPSLRDLEVTGKLHSVGEVEARFRQQQGGPKDLSGRGQTLSSKKEEELAAFKKLMMSKAHAVPQCTNTGPEMPGGMMGGFYQQPAMPLQPNQMNQPNVPNELVMKLLQVQQVQQQVQQQDALSKILTPHPGAPPLPPQIQHLVNSFNPAPELLARPETQTLLNSLKRGEVSVYQLAEQLKKTANFQSRHRDILATVIKLYQSQTGGIPPRTNSPLPPVVSEQMLHQLLLSQQQTQHQAQQLRIPSPHANGLQRVPSPRELAAHTQNILQSALIKKKLEEQKENFRKRQELQRSHSPNLSNSSINNLASNSGDSKSLRVPGANSPTPANLAFTPTSVLRKMTAGSNSSMSDKDPSLDHVNSISSIAGDKSGLDSSLHWSNPRPVGRPIVKSSSVAPPPTFQPSIPPPSMMNDYMMNVPPPSQYNVMPPRSKMSQPSSQYNNAMILGLNRPSNYPSRDMNPANRSMHRATPFPMGNASQNMFGQDAGEMPGEMSSSQVNNQLARWFSPELLAQARAGQLPNMPPVSPAQNMLSVEELERLQQPVKN